MQTKKRTRTRHLKTRTGCHTCKARRVKCDEQQPSCQKCISTGRECEGYKIRHEWVVIIAPSRCPVTDGFEDDRSKRHFDYFRTQAVYKLSRFFDADRWGKFVLQEARESPAVRHAVIALSCLHRDAMDVEMLAARGPHDAYSAQQYSRSIKVLLKETADNTQESRLRTLMCGLLFISIESIRGDNEAALHHLNGCLKIIREVRQQLGSASLERDHLESTAYLVREFLPMFNRLDRELSLLFAQRPQNLNRTPVFLDAIKHSGAELSLRTGFKSVLEALECLFWLGSRVHSITGWNPLHVNEEDPSETYIEKFTLYGQLLRWEEWVQKLALSPILTHERDKLLLLQIHHRTLLTLLGTSFQSAETFLDTYYWAFEDIVNYINQLFRQEISSYEDIPSDCRATRSNTPSQDGTLSTAPISPQHLHSSIPTTQPIQSRERAKKERPLFILDCGILFSLYWTALKCRDGRLRRRAISMLQKSMGDCMAMQAAIAKRIVEIEEGQMYDQGFINMKRAEEVREGMRVRSVDLDMKGGNNTIRLIIWRRRDGLESGDWCEHIEHVVW